MSQMIISLSGVLSYFKNKEGTFDKSESIVNIKDLIKTLIEVFVSSVLKNKGNLNQNEFIIKCETFLANLQQIFHSLL